MKKIAAIAGIAPVIISILSHLSSDWLNTYFIVYAVGYIVWMILYVFSWLNLISQVEARQVYFDKSFLTIATLEKIIIKNGLYDVFVLKIAKVRTYGKAAGIYFISGILSVILNFCFWDIP